MMFRVAYPSAQNGEDLSCIYDPKVKFYADQIAPRSNEYLTSANFNNYLQTLVDSLTDGACCQAMTADCLACSAGLSVQEYCAMTKNAELQGCT